MLWFSSQVAQVVGGSSSSLQERTFCVAMLWPREPVRGESHAEVPVMYM